jgi:hypothetical protein
MLYNKTTFNDTFNELLASLVKATEYENEVFPLSAQALGIPKEIASMVIEHLAYNLDIDCYDIDKDATIVLFKEYVAMLLQAYDKIESITDDFLDAFEGIECNFD